MNPSKAKEKAQNWISQRPKPQELHPEDVWAVLEGLGFELKGKIKHTTIKWYHPAIEKDSNYFPFGILSVSVGHAPGHKTVIRRDSVNFIIKALNIVLDNYE